MSAPRLSARGVLVPASATLLSGVLVGALVPAAVADPAPAPTVSLSAPLVTLPLGDGFNDAATITVTDAAAETVDVALVSPTGTVPVATGVALAAAGTAWTAAVPLGAPAGLAAGSWTVRVAVQGTGVVADAPAPLVVGSGTPAAVAVTLGRAAAYPYRDGVEDAVPVVLTGRDETSTLLPLSGTVRVGNGPKVVTTPVRAGAAGSTTVLASVAGLPVGRAAVVATVAGPSGTPVTGTSAVALKETGVTAARIARSTATVYPVKDGYRDTVAFTVKGSTTTGSALPASGTARLTRSGRTVQTWPLKRTTQTVRWNGKDHGRIVPGRYTLTVSVRGPQGAARTARTTVTVSPRRTTTETVKRTYSAWSIFRGCRSIGNSYSPCDQGDIWGDASGVRLYSSGSGDVMAVAASIPLPAGTTKWRLDFNKVWADDAVFVYTSTSAAAADTTSWRNGARFPTNTPSEGVYLRTGYRSGGGTAHFVIGSTAWGSLYMRSITVEAVRTVLR